MTGIDADDANGAAHNIGVRAFERTPEENCGRREDDGRWNEFDNDKKRFSSQLLLLLYCVSLKSNIQCIVIFWTMFFVL